MTTGRSIDHIVLAVKDLDKAAAAYEALGFTLTPRAAHEDRMGTSNRLAQFADKNFIEVLEVDRPEALAPHDFDQTPPFFSFGAQNRISVDMRDGISMLVFAGNDARADCAAFAAAGVQSYAPFDFDRQAKLPDGRSVTVSFSLAFATSPDMPAAAFFVCENRAQEHFWKPAFQSHDNGALGIRTVYLMSPNPQRDGAFVAKLFGGAVTAIQGGVSVSCGPKQDVRIVGRDVIAGIDPSFDCSPDVGPVFAGISLRGDKRPAVQSDAAFGIFIEWVD